MNYNEDSQPVCQWYTDYLLLPHHLYKHSSKISEIPECVWYPAVHKKQGMTYMNADQNYQ